jgi:hypothetical protein
MRFLALETRGGVHCQVVLSVAECSQPGSMKIVKYIIYLYTIHFIWQKDIMAGWDTDRNIYLSAVVSKQDSRVSLCKEENY